MIRKTLEKSLLCGCLQKTLSTKGSHVGVRDRVIWNWPVLGTESVSKTYWWYSERVRKWLGKRRVHYTWIHLVQGCSVCEKRERRRRWRERSKSRHTGPDRGRGPVIIIGFFRSGPTCPTLPLVSGCPYFSPSTLTVKSLGGWDPHKILTMT